MGEEFRVHYDVNKLLELLKADQNLAEEYTEHLLNNKSPFTTTQVNSHKASVRICEKATKPKEFINLFNGLKSENIQDLDAIVHLLSLINGNSAVHGMLTKNAEQRGDAIKMTPIIPSSVFGMSNLTLPPSGSKLTAQELIELRSTLNKAAGGSTNLNMVPSVQEFRRTLRDKHNSRRLSQHPIPATPRWITNDVGRTFLTADFIYIPIIQHSSVPIGTLPVTAQEQEVIKDLFAVFSGNEGLYIGVRPSDDKHSTYRFSLDSSMDVSISEITKSLLPIASSYSIVLKFVEEKSRFEYGLVNHALSAAIKGILKDYRSSIAQLESQCNSGIVTLQRMVFLMQPVLMQMQKLEEFVVSIDKGHCIGGSVLTMLHNQSLASVGDKLSEQLFSYLIQVSCVPYLEVLEKWIYRGQINDPYGEFMVEENKRYCKEKLQEEYNDKYWELRYTLCRDRIPVFLLQSAEKILNTGKYLNVVRECGKQIDCPGAREIIYNLHSKEYVKQIEEAHDYASKLLLDLLMQEHNLKMRLMSVKRYFLLNEGDFLLHFMDLTEDEMKMPMKEIMKTRLQALLELALRMSAADHDQYKDDLRIVLLNYDLVTQLVRILSIDTHEESAIKALGPTELNLSGLESFAFDYTVHWPWSLVISKKSLTKYQILFRHLFYMKHVERQLSLIWLMFKTIKRKNVYSKPWMMKAFTIRQRMYHFIYNFQYYMMNEVLEPNWFYLESKLVDARNVDEVLQYHNDFLEQCLKDCLLTNTTLLKILSKLMMLCVHFCNFMQSMHRQLSSKTEWESSECSSFSSLPAMDGVLFEAHVLPITAKKLSGHLNEVVSSEEYQDIISGFEKSFHGKFVELLDRVSFISREQGQHIMFNIVHRLDYNDYYTFKLHEASLNSRCALTPLDCTSMD